MVPEKKTRKQPTYTESRQQIRVAAEAIPERSRYRGKKASLSPRDADLIPR